MTPLDVGSNPIRHPILTKVLPASEAALKDRMSNDVVKTEELRELWLAKAASLLSDKIFAPAGYDVPPVRVSTGWPSARGLSPRNRVVGECWKIECAADAINQIFISPFLADPIEVLATLVHELLHAVLPEAKHGKAFKRAATAVGLEGKPTSTTAGEALRASLSDLAHDLGDYPHAKLAPVAGIRQPQTARMKKITCVTCEASGTSYVLRGSRKVIELGLPDCPLCRTPLTEAEEKEESE